MNDVMCMLTYLLLQILYSTLFIYLLTMILLLLI